MPTTYEKIATTTLGSANANIQFTSIPATYTDLRITLTATMTLAGRSGYLTFNTDNGTNYSSTLLLGNGTAASSSNATSDVYIPIDDNQVNASSTTIPTFSTIDIFSYAGSTFKTLLNTVQNDHNGSGAVIYRVGLWRSTAAITTINLNAATTTFKIGTTATLYGILKA